MATRFGGFFYSFSQTLVYTALCLSMFEVSDTHVPPDTHSKNPYFYNHMTKKLSPEHTGPRLDILYRGAFKITADTLKSFDQSLSIFGTGSKNVRKRYTVSSAGNEPVVSGNVEEIINLRNSATDRLYTIYLVIKSDTKTACITIDSLGRRGNASLSIEAIADNSEDLSKFSSSCFKESVNSRLLYWRLRKLTDYCGYALTKIPSKGWLAFTVVSAILFLGSVWMQVKYSQWRASAADAVQSAEKAIASGIELNEKTIRSMNEIRDKLNSSADYSLPYQIAIFVSVIVLVVAIPYLYSWLFPRVVFLIGDGVERYAAVKSFRIFIFITVILSGIIIPLVLDLAKKLIMPL